jgi:hypothetical protein
MTGNEIVDGHLLVRTLVVGALSTNTYLLDLIACGCPPTPPAGIQPWDGTTIEIRHGRIFTSAATPPSEFCTRRPHARRDHACHRSPCLHR